MPLMTGSFIPLAIIELAYIVLNVFHYPWPVEVADYHPEGSIDSHITCNHGIMLVLEDYLLLILITWKLYFTFMGKETVLICFIDLHFTIYGV